MLGYLIIIILALFQTILCASGGKKKRETHHSEQPPSKKKKDTENKEILNFEELRPENIAVYQMESNIHQQYRPIPNEICHKIYEIYIGGDDAPIGNLHSISVYWEPLICILSDINQKDYCSEITSTDIAVEKIGNIEKCELKYFKTVTDVIENKCKEEDAKTVITNTIGLYAESFNKKTRQLYFEDTSLDQIKQTNIRCVGKNLLMDIYKAGDPICREYNPSLSIINVEPDYDINFNDISVNLPYRQSIYSNFNFNKYTGYFLKLLEDVFITAQQKKKISEALADKFIHMIQGNTLIRLYHDGINIESCTMQYNTGQLIRRAIHTFYSNTQNSVKELLFIHRFQKIDRPKISEVKKINESSFLNIFYTIITEDGKLKTGLRVFSIMGITNLKLDFIKTLYV